MEFVKEGWEDGPTTMRDLKKPAKIRKYDIMTTAFLIGYFIVFIAWETLIALGSFVWKLINRPEPKSLKGKVCLVTGSGRGLGREFCLALAKEGAIIACADINETNNKVTAEMLNALGAKAVPYTVNVAIKKGVDELVSKIEKDLGPIYLLINNAALIYFKPRSDEEFVRASFNINVFGSLWLMDAVLPTMLKRNEGHIVNISSVASKFVIPPLTIYGATKASLSYLGNCVRSELQLANKNNIFVTNVHPNIINTSEDYIKFASLKVNLVVEMDEVVEATMDAIHYNYDEVVVPSITKYGILLVSQLMPSRTSTNIVRLVFDKWNRPNKEQEENLPWNALIKQCSFPDNKKHST